MTEEYNEETVEELEGQEAFDGDEAEDALGEESSEIEDAAASDDLDEDAAGEGAAGEDETEEGPESEGDEAAAAESEGSGENGITDEQLDEIADTAIAVLKDVLKYFNVGEVTIDEYEGDEGELILDITGNDLAVLIGRHGRTLDALQFLISAITVRKIGFRFPVIIDVESYKNRQRQKLEGLARSTANKAASQGRSMKLRPMTPYERRIIHVALRDDPRVDTASEGEGPARHVVIVPVK